MQRLGAVGDVVVARGFGKGRSLEPAGSFQLERALSQALQAHQTGNLSQAAALYQQILKLQPRQPDALYLWGMVAYQQRDYASAAERIKQAITLKPHASLFHSNLGLVYRDWGRWQQAVDHLQKAIDLDPEAAETHNSLGNLWLARGQLDQAVGCYQQALQIEPDYFEARANLGNGLASQGHWQAAIDQYQQALSTQPHPQILCNLANALLAQDRGQEAVESYQQALALTPNSAELHNNLGNALRTLNRWDAALFHYQEAIRLQPQDPQPYHNLGNTLQEQQQIPASLHWYEKALHLKPDAAETHLNLAQALLSLGDFERGLEHYEWRLLCRASSPRSLTQPRWDGSPLQGRTVLVYAEQGLGDTIQFIRYAQHLAQQGERVVVECPASLTRLLQTGSGLQAVVATGSALPPFDLHAPLLSLPLLCGTRLDSIPAACPYLQAPEPPIPLPMPTSTDLTKVGIVWAGGHYRTSLTARRAYQLKSCPVERMMDLLQLPGLHLISLQVGEDAEALQPYLAHERVWDLSAQLQDFADTASVVAQLDLVISVDTAVAHLAGALGKPVWVLLPFAADWRWLLDRADSPWYPTMRLFRQTHPGDWRGVLTQVSQALASGI